MIRPLVKPPPLNVRWPSPKNTTRRVEATVLTGGYQGTWASFQTATDDGHASVVFRWQKVT